MRAWIPNWEFIAQYWYFLIPEYLLGVLIWTMLGRFVLGLFVPENWDNYIWRFFRRLTDPVLDAVRWITPRFMVEPLLPLVAVFWLVVLRIGLHAAMFPDARLFWWATLYMFGVLPAPPGLDS